jgi:homoserine dehydrogenase
MENEGLPFDTVLKDAQRLGYAEANPSLDVDGFDTAHKACILATLAFGFQPKVDDIQVNGIRDLAGEDVKYAADFGYRIKLLASVSRHGDEVAVSVNPTLVPFTHMLSNVNDAFNAVMVKGDMSDYTMYYGRGAGRAPTASTVVGDIGDIARNLAHGETRYERGAPNYAEGKVTLRAAGEISSKFYIRFLVADKPGAFGTIASILGKHSVSISAASQKAAAEDGKNAVPVVVLTHTAKVSDLDNALAEIKASGVIADEPVALRIL